jgi:multiple sugar transport system ATP-binding protein
MASVSLKRLVKRYGGHAVIPGIDLEIPDREFVVFLGPSGCGKSTLLRIIAGLEPVDEGELRIGGRRVNEVPAAQRDVAMVFQDYALYPHMTVFENMAFGLEMRGTPREEMARRVNDAARMLHLEELLDRKPKALSGGQRQRVAMGRAIVRQPQVFLFDEPLSNLDAQLRGRVRTEIKRLSLALRTTMIFVTHDQVEAMTLAERIVVLNAGKVQQVGTPEEIYNRPANLFVAGFIGAPAMNFFPATVRAGADGSEAVLADGTRLALTAAQGEALARAGVRRVRLGVRPENLVSRNGTHEGGFRVQLDVVETLGSDTYGYFTLAGRQYVGRLKADFGIRPGAEMELGFELERAHFFSEEDGRAIR